MGDDEDLERGPGVAQHVKNPDPPIDKTKALNAVLGAIVMTGTSGKGPGTVPLDGGRPTNVSPPVQVKEFNSGVAPHVEYDFALGPDGKIYGTADKGNIPPGKVRKLHIKLTRTHQGWVATTDIIDGKTYVGTAMSGAPNSMHDEADAQRILDVKRTAHDDIVAAEKAELDARTRGDEAGVAKAVADKTVAGQAWSKAETQLADRFYNFFPNDATTAVRQTLVKLQTQGKLYDVSKEDAPPVTDTVPAGGRPKWVIPAVVGGVAAAAIAAALVLGGGSSSTTSNAADTAAQRSAAVVPTAVSPPTTPKPLPMVCDVLDAAVVGGLVNRPMTSSPQIAGNGCKYTATDEPNIDVSTAYPPYIAQVNVNYNAPQAGLPASQIEQLFTSSRPADGVDVPAGDARAYSNGGGSAVVLDRDVMIIVSTSGTLRPESIPDVQAMCVQIASQLRAKLP